MKKKLLLNTVISIIFQIVTLICGFILPRLILQQYGSEVNGLVQSITQFLSLIAFLELGVGAVIQSALYKALADKDSTKISQILKSGDNFFKKLALILLVYVVILVGVYPFIAKQEFGWVYTALLILSMSISSFAQYYFGIIDRLLLTADQRGYIQYTSQIATLILNTIACVIEIQLGFSIHVVKLSTSIIYLIRPLLLRVYVNHHYAIDRHIKLEGEPIKQKWNGLAQHVTAIILNDTDTVVLTAFSSLSNVSIYSAHYMVVNGVKNLLLSGTNGIQSAMGEMIAKDEEEKVRNFFAKVEFILHTLVIFIFTCTAILITPFITVYTDGITDANYIQPLFAVLLVTAHASHCLRLPYNIAILAAGHYKQTQRCHIVAAVLNVAISIITVFVWGLIGVAIGTLVSMIYQTIWMAIYDSKKILQWPIKHFIKQCFVDLLIVVCIIGATFWIKLATVSYFSWIIMACEVAGIALIITLLISFIFYNKVIKDVLKSFFAKVKK